MNLVLEQHTRKIMFSFSIVTIYLTDFILIANATISFLITLIIFIISRELFYDKLYTGSDVNESLIIEDSAMSILQSESDILPDNIRSIIMRDKKQPNLLYSTDLKGENSSQDEILITAFQKAESMIDSKIKELQAKQKIRKTYITIVQGEIKEELAKTLPEVPKKEEQWTSWSPLVLNEKLLHLEIFCDKCNRPFQVQDTTYEVETQSDHYLIKAIHELQEEKHINTVKVTLDTFEILSKPVIDFENVKKVEA